MPKLSKLAGNFALVIFLVAVGAAAALVVFHKKAPAAPSGKTTQPSPSYAPKGELTPGFPKELILDNKAAPGGSYAVNYGTGPSLRTTSFDSNKSMLSLFNLYKTYFKDNGWIITNEVTKYKDSRGLYAIKSREVASVAISDNGKTRQVVVNYAGK